MKTVVCQEPGEFRLVETERPRAGPGEALVRIRRVGVCGTDLHAFRGQQPYFTYPRVLGHELAGEVVELPPGTRDLEPGQPVVIIPYLECGRCIACRRGRPNACVQLNVVGVHSDGGMREYLNIRADHLIPAGAVDLDEAALVECLAIGAHAVGRARLEPGEFALVVGCGPIGLGALQFARQAGARVIALDVDENRLAFARDELGAEHAVRAGEGAVREIGELSGGDFPTAVFDATGSPRAMEASFRYVAHGGRLVYISLVKGRLGFDDPEFHKREMTLLGSRNATRADFQHVLECLSRGSVRASCLVTHKSSLEGVVESLSGWLRPDQRVLKALLEVD